MKQGEIDYIKSIGEAGARHAYDKPFSDATCAKNLIDVGVILSLLPPPPSRLLDLGCGTGWTSVFFAKRGYSVLGQDIAPDMIELAYRNKRRHGVEQLEFVVSDYESMPFESEFDGAVFYDALHHAEDEAAAVKAVWRALKPGGVLITHEPGTGHSKTVHAMEAMRLHDVNEKDMPPAWIFELGRRAGFRKFEQFTDPTELLLAFLHINVSTSSRATEPRGPLWRRLARALRETLPNSSRGAICVLQK
jgi:SAM-dependent methyltransferase